MRPVKANVDPREIRSSGAQALSLVAADKRPLYSLCIRYLVLIVDVSWLHYRLG